MDTPRLLSCLVLVCALPLQGVANPPPRPPIFYRTVVLEGDPVPGVPDGAFAGFPNWARVNDRGEVLFLGQARRSQTPGVFHASGDDPADITPVALIGAQAPGFADGIVFGSLDQNPLRINRSGQVLFEATLEGPGIVGPNGTNSNARSVWLWNGAAPALSIWHDPARRPGRSRRERQRAQDERPRPRLLLRRVVRAGRRRR